MLDVCLFLPVFCFRAHTFLITSLLLLDSDLLIVMLRFFLSVVSFFRSCFENKWWTFCPGLACVSRPAACGTERAEKLKGRKHTGMNGIHEQGGSLET